MGARTKCDGIRHPPYAILSSEVNIHVNFYFALFNAITDAIEALARVQDQLRVAQQIGEELYIAETEEPD